LHRTASFGDSRDTGRDYGAKREQWETQRKRGLGMEHRRRAAIAATMENTLMQL